MSTDYKEYYAFLNRELSFRISDLCLELMGKPSFQKQDEWRYGKKGSLSVGVKGTYQGKFYDFETGVRGSALDLITHIKGLTGKDLCQWARYWLGIIPQSCWQAISPVPLGTPDPDFAKAPLSYLAKGKSIEALYPYKDLEGRLYGYVVRLIDQNGQKITPMLSLWQTNMGRISWRWKGFEGKRLPYGAENMKDNSKLVLVVEGEKTAEAAKSLFPDYVVLTWIGGVRNVLKTDWSCLKERVVIIFPDNDKPGHEAAQILKNHLLEKNVSHVSIVSLPEDTPPKWDLADPLPGSWVSRFLTLMINSTLNQGQII